MNPIKELKKLAEDLFPCTLKVDNFNWAQFSRDLEYRGQELKASDFDPEDKYISQTVEIQTTSPIKLDITKFIDDNDLNKNPQNLKKVCPDFYDGIIDKVIEAAEGNFWEIEESETPSGYRGKFKTTYILVDLDDIEVDEIVDLEQDQNGIVSMGISIQVPFKYRQYEDSLT